MEEGKVSDSVIHLKKTNSHVVCMILYVVINVTAVVESTFPLPTNATTLTDEAQGSPPTLSWIVAGVVGGLFLLIVVLLLVINIAVAVVVTKKRRKKKYNVSGQDVKICQQNTSNVTNSKF